MLLWGGFSFLEVSLKIVKLYFFFLELYLQVFIIKFQVIIGSLGVSLIFNQALDFSLCLTKLKFQLISHFLIRINLLLKSVLCTLSHLVFFIPLSFKLFYLLVLFSNVFITLSNSFDWISLVIYKRFMLILLNGEAAWRERNTLAHNV
jgi:hypothetical protein